MQHRSRSLGLMSYSGSLTTDRSSLGTVQGLHSADSCGLPCCISVSPHIADIAGFSQRRSHNALMKQVESSSLDIQPSALRFAGALLTELVSESSGFAVLLRKCCYATLTHAHLEGISFATAGVPPEFQARTSLSHLPHHLSKGKP